MSDTSKWVFPPPGNASNVPSNLDFNTTVLQFLNTSALYAPPRNGSFGEAWTYKFDDFQLEWRSVPTGDSETDREARDRTVYCMPGREQPNKDMDGHDTRLQYYYYCTSPPLPPYASLTLTPLQRPQKPYPRSTPTPSKSNPASPSRATQPPL